jgi:hypothetical protein
MEHPQLILNNKNEPIATPMTINVEDHLAFVAKKNQFAEMIEHEWQH